MSIHKRSNGTYRVMWRDEGTLKSKTFTSMKEAQTFNARMRLKTLGESEKKNSEMIFFEFVKIWFENVCKVECTHNTQVSSRSRVNNYLLPKFGNIKLCDLSSKHLIDLRQRMLVKQMATSTVNQTIVLARTILQKAVEWNYLNTNPWTIVKCLKLAEQPFDYWSRDELRRFLSWSMDHNRDLFEIVTVAVFTGMRRGEISGLTRDAIDYDKRIITVSKTYSEYLKAIQKYTKNKKIRTIPMNRSVLNVLRDKQLLAPTDRIFPKRLHQISDQLSRACKKAGVKVIRFHDLRHTFASHLVLSGESIYKVSKILGHSGIQMTERYAHLNTDELQGITDVLDGVAISVATKSQVIEISR